MSKKDLEIQLGKEFSKIYRDCRFKKCVFPDQSKCSNRVIRAHSIQKNKILSQIAENGNVISSDMRNMLFHQDLKEIGIGLASTFFGFCNHHDTTLFSEIENKDFKGRIEQNFLHSYRACAIEFVNKNEASCFFKRLIRENKNSPFLQYFKNELLGFQYGVKDLTVVMGQFSDELLKPKSQRQYDIISTTIKELPYESLVAVNSCFVIEYDFDGNLINDLENTSKIPAHIFFNVFPQKNKTFILFSCLTENLNIYQGIISKIEEFHLLELEIFFSNLIISHCENFFISPPKWRNLSNRLKTMFIQKYMGTLTMISPNNLSRGSINLFKLFQK